ncbi:uncharacterized protein METZ01_LOCUS512926, partial [marine metagenome]
MVSTYFLAYLFRPLLPKELTSNSLNYKEGHPNGPVAIPITITAVPCVKGAHMEGQLRKPEQDYGNNPKAVRDTDQYQAEYIREFVSKWDSLIDWDGRAKAEGSFFIDHLKSRGVKQVLDVATGTGFHSVRLLEAGFEVVS